MSMADKKTIYKEIDNYSLYLKLPAIKRIYLDEIKEANLKDITYEEFLHKLLQQESDLRNENSKQNRIRMANFPFKKYLEDLIIEDLPEDARKKLKALSSLDFIETGQNVILAGNPGTGKTHLSVGLGIKACLA